MDVYLQLPLYVAKSNNIMSEWSGNRGRTSQVTHLICAGAGDQIKITVDRDVV